jgi:hypothetical protein
MNKLKQENKLKQDIDFIINCTYELVNNKIYMYFIIGAEIYFLNLSWFYRNGVIFIRMMIL